MKDFLSKKGSFTIFALFLFIALIISLWIIINAAGSLAMESTVNSFGTIWGKSILSEYDLILRNRYGLLAYYDNQQSVKDKLTKYINYTIEDKDYIFCEEVECELEDYSLINIDNMIEQIESITLGGTKPVVEKQEIQQKNTVRSINNPWIIKSLPSYGKTENLYIIGLADKIKEGMALESIIENSLIDKYIFNFFKDYMESRDLGETYFDCEVEYIISGQFDDWSLKEDTEDKIVVLRNILNLFYLYTCQEKRDSVMVLASSITPGAMAFITQGVLLETWAFAEAKNDMKLLYDNKAVALLKDDDNWALNIENVFNTEQGAETIEKEEQEQYVLPAKVEGANYSEYLRLLLYGLPKDTKLLRIMDLIQINMKYTYCDYFLLKDYNCGLTYRLKINGNEYEFKEEYVE